jgi:hypothetical protein
MFVFAFLWGLFTHSFSRFKKESDVKLCWLDYILIGHLEIVKDVIKEILRWNLIQRR